MANLRMIDELSPT